MSFFFFLSGGENFNSLEKMFYLHRTSAMAEDVICLLDFLGWTADRELNIVGISLGGMIAQGQLIPNFFYVRLLYDVYRAGIPDTEPHFIAPFSRDNSRRAYMGEFPSRTHLRLPSPNNSKLKCVFSGKGFSVLLSLHLRQTQ